MSIDQCNPQRRDLNAAQEMVDDSVSVIDHSNRINEKGTE